MYIIVILLRLENMYTIHLWFCFFTTFAARVFLAGYPRYLIDSGGTGSKANRVFLVEYLRYIQPQVVQVGRLAGYL